MAKAWAIAGVDLHVEIVGSRVRASLEQAVRDAVRSGRLPEGLRLPSSRQLAADLDLARNTVADAYGQLVAEGWLVARQGSGTRVARRVPDRDAATGRPATTSPPPPRFDLRVGTPDLASFPASAWMAALRRSITTSPVEAFGYGDPRGRTELREALAGYLARARGVRADPERIVVCSGFMQGLALVCAALAAGTPGGAIAVEAYGLPVVTRISADHGLRPAPLTVDDEGAVVDELTDEVAAVLTPAHQFPLGPSLGASRRSAAAAWAAQGGGVVVEDDYDGEFRYDRHPLGAMQALAPDHVVYAGTASKTLAPGLRLAWLVLPRALMEPVLAAKAVADHTSALEQLTLAEFIRGGGYDRHVRGRRLAYRRRRDLLLRTLARAAPEVAVIGIAAGLHVLVTLPPGLSEDEVAGRAARRGLAVGGLEQFRMGGSGRSPALVVGYATPPDHAYSGALARLVAALTPRSRR